MLGGTSLYYEATLFCNRDDNPDGVFREDVSLWKKSFSNQSALFRTSDNGILWINEFRRVGQGVGRSVRASIYGTEGAFEEQSNGAVWTNRKREIFYIESDLKCRDVGLEEISRIRVAPHLMREFSAGFAPIHEKYRFRLPASYHGQPNGREGSHQFLVDDFARAVVEGIAPSAGIRDAIRFNATGIVAHESSLREGENLTIPEIG